MNPPDVEQVAQLSRRMLALLHPAGSVVELRVLGLRSSRFPSNIASGLFDNVEALLRAAYELERECYESIIVTMNGVNVPAGTKIPNTLHAVSKGERLTSDDVIARRTAIMIDVDPVKSVDGAMATMQEQQGALDVAAEIVAELGELEWPQPLSISSGNGAQILYPVDLPTQDDGLVAAVLKGLAAKFNSERANIDTSCSNAARLCRVPGTWNRKGANTGERPHRRAVPLSVPEELSPVPRRCLEEAASWAEAAAGRQAMGGASNGHLFDVDAFLVKHALAVSKSGPWVDGGYRWELECCPFNPEHLRKASIQRHGNGAVSAGCRKASCQWRWQDLREKFEPGCYDKARRGGGTATESDGDNKKRTNRATRLVELALGSCELFHAPDGRAYADVIVDGHRETHALRGRGFRDWIGRMFFETESSAPGGQAVRDALDVLDGHARYGATERQVYVRVAGLPNATYLDLGDSTWDAVEIDKNGWRMVQRPPVRFRRAGGMLALQRPTQCGSIDALRDFLPNIEPANYVLLVSWLVATLRGVKPFPILALQGPQGSGKSILAEMLRRASDLSSAPLRAAPREERDLIVAAGNAWVLAFDNLSHMPEWLSDAMCRLSTGGGFSARALYTDSEEHLFSGTRPILLTGIPDLLVRLDLGSRSIIIRLPDLGDDQRVPEAALWQRFDGAVPSILGALLDGVAMSIAQAPNVKLAKLPRLADFAVTATAAEAAFEWTPGTFMEAYTANAREVVEGELAADDVAVYLTKWIQEGRNWRGSATELLDKLNFLAPDHTRKSRSWPTTGSHLSNRLRRLAPALKVRGIQVTFGREGESRARVIEIEYRKGAENAVRGVSAVQPPENTGLATDGDPDGDETAPSTPRTTDPDPNPSRTAADGARTAPRTPANPYAGKASAQDGESHTLALSPHVGALQGVASMNGARNPPTNIDTLSCSPNAVRGVRRDHLEEEDVERLCIQAEARRGGSTGEKP